MVRFERVNATDLVVKTIRSRIRSGDLKVGDRLPKEIDMAEQLGVGRSSLREGMKILDAFGVIESRQGEGTFVVDKQAERFFDMFGFQPGKETMEWFLELRKILEIGNILTIYQKVDDGFLDRLEKLLDIFEEKGHTIEEYCEMDKEFHNALMSYTENPMISQLDLMIAKMRNDLLVNLFAHEEIIEDARKAHREILNALRAHDGIRCYKAVSEHLETTVEHVENLY